MDCTTMVQVLGRNEELYDDGPDPEVLEEVCDGPAAC